MRPLHRLPGTAIYTSEVIMRLDVSTTPRVERLTIPRLDALAAAAPFDAIVIGSGMGGLAAAAALARIAGKRVLVLERHTKLGGFTHSFRRPGGFAWDVGLHYVGGMASGTQPRQLMDLVTGGDVTWAPLPTPYDQIDYPEWSCNAPAACPPAFADSSSAESAEDDLDRRRFDRLMSRVARWYGLDAWARAVPRWLSPCIRVAAGPYGRIARETTSAVLARTIRSPRSRVALASQWSDYGVAPASSAFGVHAVVMESYRTGAFYPVGGASALVRAMARQIHAHGGQCVTGAEVTEIVVDAGGTAIGVRVWPTRRPPNAQPTFLAARRVISDAGARATYTTLLPPAARPAWATHLAREPQGLSAVVLFVGLSSSPSTVGITGENRWLFRTEDHDADATDALLAGHALRAYVSVGTQRDPSAATAPPTAQVLAWVRPDAFDPWRTGDTPRHDASYLELKARITDALLTLVEERIPGFRRLVVHAELATPLTIEHFTGHAGGACYGVPATPRRLSAPWIGARTPVRHLWLAGADACSPGIVGAMMGGMFAAGGVLGPLGFVQILRHASANHAANDTHVRSLSVRLEEASHVDYTPVYH
ncbi:MAG: FAD-dependent oxidoreductase [Gemmatimonadaceae bacterium]|nr:FAD-dependent oxidoreductase [Gemmatimonadaceae bacterium]